LYRHVPTEGHFLFTSSDTFAVGCKSWHRPTPKSRLQFETVHDWL